MIVNGIGDEGAKGVCEMLKVNATLKVLDLWSQEERKMESEKKKE